MEPSTLIFTSDGCRGIMDDAFTDAAVIHVADAFARTCGTIGHERTKTIAVGFDGRRSSQRFAVHVAEVCSSYGYRVILSNAIIPTAVLSFTVGALPGTRGVMITGGSAPSSFNGMRFLAGDGRPFAPDDVQRVKAALTTEARPFDPMREAIVLTDLLPAYLAHLRALVDGDLLRSFGDNPQSHAALIIDSMGGAGQTLLEDLLASYGWRAQTIFGTADPNFYDRTPEASSHHLEPLIYNVNVTHTLFGIAADGDASGWTLVDEDGVVIPGQDVSRALAHHLRAHARIAEPERDAILAGLLCAELIASSGMTLRAAVDACT